MQYDSDTIGRVSETVARNFGTGRFLVIQTGLVILWIILNVTLVALQWDPYPFILLNLMFSVQAAYAAPLILLAANRQEARDRVQAELDRQVAERTQSETEFLAREIAGVRLMLADVVTGEELRDQLEELRTGGRPPGRSARRPRHHPGCVGRRRGTGLRCRLTGRNDDVDQLDGQRGERHRVRERGEVVGRELAHDGVQFLGQRALLRWPHDAVPRHDQASGRQAQRRSPRASVVVGQGPPGIDHRKRVVARHLADEPRHVGLQGVAGADELGDAAVEVSPVPTAAQPRADDREEPPEQALAAGAAPLEACGLDDEAGDELGVARARCIETGPPMEYPTAITGPTPSSRMIAATSSAASSSVNGSGERRPRPWPRWSMPMNVKRAASAS